PAAAIVTMVDPVANAGVADTLEACLANARKRHADGEYGTIPLLIVELGIRLQALGNVACDSGRDCTDVWLLQVVAGPDYHRTAAKSTGPHHLEGVDRTSAGGRRAEGRCRRHSANSARGRCRATWGFRAAHLLTFMVILRCCSSVVQLALRSCRERLDAGHQAWHFIPSTYQVRDDMYIGQFEETMTHIRMGEQESATDYCNRARRIVAEMRMAGAEYSTASYISHIVKGLPRGYNLMKRMMMHQGQRGKPGGGGSGGGRSTKDVDEKRSTRDKGRGGGSRRRDDEYDTKGGRGRSTSPRLRRDAELHKEKQTSKKTSATKDVDNSSGKSQGDGEASCSMVGAVEPTVSLAPEAGEDLQAVAAAVQANPMAVLLDSGCSHHPMGTKAVFVDMALSDGVKHVRGFNEALQPVEGRGTGTLQGEVGKRVLIPDVLYIPGVNSNLLSAGQLKESGVQL
ncbi:unnamed protein product, partial [Closterium sp. NIES-54]